VVNAKASPIGFVYHGFHADFSSALFF
jgi:hypothetical protein